MKVLLIYSLYYENNKQVIDHKDKLRTSFEAAFENDESHTYEVLHLGNGPGDLKNANELNHALLTKDFDLVVVSEESQYIVYLETAKKLGKKLFLLHWDTWIAMSPDIHVNFKIAMKASRNWGGVSQPHSLVEFSQYCNILVIDYGFGEMFPNMYSIPSFIDTRDFYPDSSVSRDIDVSHNGMMYIPERARYAEIFHKAKVNITYTGSINKNIFPAQLLSVKDFAEIFRRSKISLCFTESIFGAQNKQRKTRIYEIAASGSFMLMSHGEVLDNYKYSWFKKGVHFDAINESNCIEKIEYYLKNSEKRNEIANAFYEHYINNYSPKILWNNIFTYVKDK
jgi:hypothetical protein